MPSSDTRDLSGLANGPFPAPPPIWETVHRILNRKREFGITRLGAVTGLDRIGIQVVQVIRPASRSVAVNQGKGLTHAQAAISGLMESLEGWASERVAPERIWKAELTSRKREGIWSHLLDGLEQSARSQMLSWIEGWDMMTGTRCPVPLGLVDTNYVIPSPHPRWLERNTTGLAAGTSLQQALTHACFEVLERHAHCMAMERPHFFDRFQIDVDTIRTGVAGGIIRRLKRAGFATGVWAIPAAHAMPVYWCHVMEGSGQAPLAPLPASGFGCDQTHDRALTKALLEACQSRLGVISAAREDVTDNCYRSENSAGLSAWRVLLSRRGLSYPIQELHPSGDNVLRRVLESISVAGAKAAIAVVLFSDESLPLHVVRVVAPSLKSNPEQQNNG